LCHAGHFACIEPFEFGDILAGLGMAALPIGQRRNDVVDDWPALRIVFHGTLLGWNTVSGEALQRFDAGQTAFRGPRPFRPAGRVELPQGIV
jgi:hypothetical protein